MGVNQVNFWFKLVRILPKKLVYFCFVHVMAQTTSGKYSGTIVPELAGMDAMKRFANDHNI